MPRRPGAPEEEDPFYRPEGEERGSRRRAAVLEEEEGPRRAQQDDQAFLRARKRVPVRRGSVPRQTAKRLLWGGISLLVVTVMGLTALTAYRYETHSWRFRIETSDNIETEQLQNVSRAQVLDVFGGDIGRNVFFVPLEQRQEQLEKIPWVESATIMRLLPNRIRVAVRERTPIAFAQIRGTVALIDANGVVMEMPRTGTKFSFPVVTGFTGSEPLSVRAARMRIYARLMRELDAGNMHYSEQVSEIDLSDAEDLRITVGDANGTVLIHLGTADLQRHYRFYLEHINGWRQQYQVHSVDLRFDGQVIVNREGQAQ